MRVCFYHAEPEWSGRARAFVDAAAALRDRGYEVTIVCARGSSVERRLAAAGEDVIGIRTSGGWLRVAWRIRRVLKRNFVEAVFVHSEREQLEAAAATRLADRGAVVRRMPPFGRLILGRDARFAARIAATGFLFAFDADMRAARPPARALEPFVAPPGIASQSSGAARARSGGPTIACFFNHESRGGVSIALRAVALLAERHPDLRLSLIGPVDLSEALTLQAASLGIVTRVELPPEDATNASERARIAQSDLGWILASGDDAMFGILDCYAAGVPVVAEQNPLSGRLVRDGETGTLTAPVNAENHAALLAALLTDHQRRERLAAGASAAAANWPVSAMADGFIRATTVARDRTQWRAQTV